MLIAFKNSLRRITLATRNDWNKPAIIPARQFTTEELKATELDDEAFEREEREFEEEERREAAEERRDVREAREWAKFLKRAILLTITSRIRANGLGAGGWIAHVPGPCEKYGLERRRLRYDGEREEIRKKTREGNPGIKKFYIREPGLYEMRKLIDFEDKKIACFIFVEFERYD